MRRDRRETRRHGVHQLRDGEGERHGHLLGEPARGGRVKGNLEALHALGEAGYEEFYATGERLNPRASQGVL